MAGLSFVRTSALLVAAGALLVGGATELPGQAATRSQSRVEAVQRQDHHQPTSAQLPHGGRRIFDHRFLVAYYGTAGTGALGVLGETSPRVMTQRLHAAARPFRHGDVRIQIVYELIASIADAGPGTDGDYSHYITNDQVRTYVRAAGRNQALLVLDLQPGRSDFLTQAKHFGWALQKPWVGLALDPEWRMGSHEVPARSIGSVRAAEVNRVSRYVARIRRNNDLPQKLFMIHQFRPEMVQHIQRIKPHRGLALVQHVDGFGTQTQKLATFHRVVKPGRFTLGFKLFYDEDTHRFKPRQVLKIRPRIRFVSYQ